MNQLTTPMKLWCQALTLVVSVSLGCNPQSHKNSLDVMSSGGFTAAYQALAPEFTSETNTKLNTVYGASLGGAPTSIPERMKRNEPADVVILASQGLERLIHDGHVLKESRVDLASSLIGMAVQAGDSIPDINSVESFMNVLRDCKSIAFSASASGTYLGTQLFPSLPMADELGQKSKRIVGERVGEVVARGEAEIGFQQVSELLPIKGITYVGAIPDEMQRTTVFSIGITSKAKNIEAAKSLIKYLSSPEAAEVIMKTGMKPLNK